MSAWGFHNFANDGALDFVTELESHKSLDLIYQEVNEAFKHKDDYLEALTCSRILAAAEIMAAFVGESGVDLPREAHHWIAARKKIRFLRKPLQIEHTQLKIVTELVELIIKDSELKILWEEAGHDDYHGWLQIQTNLLQRLKKSCQSFGLQ